MSGWLSHCVTLHHCQLGPARGSLAGRSIGALWLAPNIWAKMHERVLRPGTDGAVHPATRF